MCSVYFLIYQFFVVVVQKSHNVEAKIWLQSKEHKKTEYSSDNIQI